MSSIPEGVKQPQDRKSPAQREAEGVEGVESTFDGLDLSLPADPLAWPTDVTEAFEDGKAIRAIKGILGEKRYNKIGIGKWPLRKTNALFEEFARLAGFDDMGE